MTNTVHQTICKVFVKVKSNKAFAQKLLALQLHSFLFFFFWLEQSYFIYATYNIYILKFFPRRKKEKTTKKKKKLNICFQYNWEELKLFSTLHAGLVYRISIKLLIITRISFKELPYFLSFLCCKIRIIIKQPLS